MLKEALEKRVGHLNNDEFVVICEIVTNDIKFNRINFGKCTSLNYVLDIAATSASIFKRCA